MALWFVSYATSPITFTIYDVSIVIVYDVTLLLSMTYHFQSRLGKTDCTDIWVIKLTNQVSPSIGFRVPHYETQPPVPLDRIFFRLFTIEISLAIANNLKPIGMMKMLCVTIFPNIYECVSDYMKIHHDISEQLRTICERSKIAED